MTYGRPSSSFLFLHSFQYDLGQIVLSLTSLSQSGNNSNSLFHRVIINRFTDITVLWTSWIPKRASPPLPTGSHTFSCCRSTADSVSSNLPQATDSTNKVAISYAPTLAQLVAMGAQMWVLCMQNGHVILLINTIHCMCKIKGWRLKFGP